jgi:rhodanese-related sulfurtransferase
MTTIPTVHVEGVPDPVPPGLSVLDVREPTEWEHGHIDGAQHIPLGELGARVGEVPEGQVLVVCRIGGRSAQAVAWLGQQGHDAVNLEGGMLDWEAAGRPMVSETGRTPQVV